METLESLQKAIDTTRDLQSIVRTMKVLAAVSIRQYERAVLALADYARTVDLGLQVVLRQEPVLPAAVDVRRERRLGVVVFGSDLGLCGRFNENVTRLATQWLATCGVESASRHLLVVGARADAGMQAAGHRVGECFFVPGTVSAITATVGQLLRKIDEWQGEGVEEVVLFYNRRRAESGYTPVRVNLLPVDFSRFADVRERPWASRSLPTFSVSSERLMASLIRQHLFISLFRACAESLASEHASRLVSMQLAEKNIKERLEDLGGHYRRQRQNAITSELLDVVSGFEAQSR